MNKIICNEITQEQSEKYIDFCLKNSNSAAYFNGGCEFFINNPHFYLNSSDDIMQATSIVKQNDCVLTVGSSGDYMLNAIYHGAREVVNYDINSIQYFIIALKYYAIQILTYEEFVAFFTQPDSKYFLSPNILEKVIDSFKEEPAYIFWYKYLKQLSMEDELFCTAISMQDFSRESSEPERLRFQFLAEVGPKINPSMFKAVRLIQVEHADIEKIDYLSSKENYNKTKENLKNAKVSFISCDICEIKDKLQKGKQFDAIFTSNIQFYLKASVFSEVVLEQLLPFLKDEGIISSYHQGMKEMWFKNKVKDSNYNVPKSEFNTDDILCEFSIAGVANSIKANRTIVKSGKLKVTYEEFPTYGGVGAMNSKKDVITNMKRKVKKLKK